MASRSRSRSRDRHRYHHHRSSHSSHSSRHCRSRSRDRNSRYRSRSRSPHHAHLHRHRDVKEENRHRASSSAGEDAPPQSSMDEKKKKEQRPRNRGTQAELEERFPFLKYAPRQEHTKANADLTMVHKPLGLVVRNIRCLRCGQWGHQSRDRECPMQHAITPEDERRLELLDPMRKVRELKQQQQQQQQQQEQQQESPLALLQQQRFTVKQEANVLKQEDVDPQEHDPNRGLDFRTDLEPVLGAPRADDPNQQMLSDDEDAYYGRPAGSYPPGEDGMTLELLMRNQRRKDRNDKKAKKKAKKEKKAKKKKAKKEKKKDKKHKKDRKHRSSSRDKRSKRRSRHSSSSSSSSSYSSSSSSSSSSSDSDDEERILAGMSGKELEFLQSLSRRELQRMLRSYHVEADPPLGASGLPPGP